MNTRTAIAVENSSAALAKFLSELRYEDLPASVIARTEEAFVDWFGCAMAGYAATPTLALEKFAAAMGPASGPSEILSSRARTSPYFAALVNGAASHVAELDDVHNGAGFHPGTVVFPAVFAAAQGVGATGRQFIASSVAGYETAIRTGEFLGAEHYKIFHTTGTAGTLGAAAGVGHLLELNSQSMLNALGSAGTQAAGLWEFLRDEADSKVLHSAKAAANGLLSAYTARDGLTGASRILEGKQGLGAGLSSKTDPARITDGLGTRWTTLECTYKPYACCRHAHPAADALLAVIRENNLKADEIAHVTAFVHQRAMGVLGEVRNPQTVRQAKFCMGFVLALIATYGRAGINDFSEATLRDLKLRAFERRVEMVVDPTIPGTILERPGRVEVSTTDGRLLTGRVIAAKGDPSNTLDRDELAAKAQQLAAYTSAATPDEMDRVISASWKLHELPNLDGLFLGHSPS